MRLETDEKLLNDFLQVVERALAEAGMDVDTGPNLYQPLAVEHTKTSASVSEIEPRNDSASDPDDERSEPGLRSSLNVPDEKVATMSSHRANTAGVSEDDEEAGGLFQNMPWEEGSDSEAFEGDTLAKNSESARGSDETESAGGFMADLPWDETEAASVRRGSDDAEKSGDADETDSAGGFMADLPWDETEPDARKSASDEAAEQGEAQQEVESIGKDSDEAGRFMSNIDWEGASSESDKVSIASDSLEEPPEHVKKAMDDERVKDIPPATEDALERSAKSAGNGQEGSDDERDK